MNILHASATYAPFIGGAETYVRTVAERLAIDDHHVCVATTDAAEVEAFWDPHKLTASNLNETLNGVPIHRARVSHTPFSPLSFYVYRRLAVEMATLPGARFVLRTLARLMPWVPGFGSMLDQFPEHFELVHAVNIALEWPLIASWHYARRRSIPFIVTPFVHVGEPGNRYVARNYTMPHQIEVLHDADAVIVQTEVERNYLAEFGVDVDRMHVLGMGIELDAMRGGDGCRFRAQYGLHNPIVLFMGVITKDKGIVHLVEAMRRLWAEGTDISLVIAGRPVTEFEQYWQLLPDEVTQHIVRTGVITGQAKQDALAAADIFALPSRIDSFGIVFLEAWSYALPVIGARAGGIPAVIADQQDGLLVDYGDVPALTAAICRLLQDAPLRKRLGAAGQTKVTDRYTWDRIYRRLLAIYQAVVASPRYPPHA